MGAVDINLNIVIPFEYDDINYASDVIDDNLTYINCYNFDGSSFCYVYKDGQLTKTVNTSLYYCADGLFEFVKDEKIGFIDSDFNVVVEPTYDTLFPFSEGLALVGNFKGLPENGMSYGYVDKTGELVIPMIFDKASSFSNGQAVVLKDKKYYFISLIDENIPKVILNNEMLEFPTNPVIIDGTTYVPIKKIAEGLDATVTFEPNTKNTLVELNEKELSFNKNNNAIIKNDTMLIPVRYISESFGAEVLLEQSTKTVTINQYEKKSSSFIPIKKDDTNYWIAEKDGQIGVFTIGMTKEEFDKTLKINKDILGEQKTIKDFYDINEYLYYFEKFNFTIRDDKLMTVKIYDKNYETNKISVYDKFYKVLNVYGMSNNYSDHGDGERFYLYKDSESDLCIIFGVTPSNFLYKEKIEYEDANIYTIWYQNKDTISEEYLWQ